MNLLKDQFPSVGATAESAVEDVIESAGAEVGSVLVESMLEGAMSVETVVDDSDRGVDDAVEDASGGEIAPTGGGVGAMLSPTDSNILAPFTASAIQLNLTSIKAGLLKLIENPWVLFLVMK